VGATESMRCRDAVMRARHGADFGELLRLLSDDCPKRKSITVYDVCGIHCPGLPAFFLGKTD
jgi:hypothetical protein